MLTNWKIFIKYNVIWRNYLLCTRYIYEVQFLMLWWSNEDTTEYFFIDDVCFNAYVPPCVVAFCKSTDRIKYVGLILKVLCRFPIRVAYLVHCPDLQSVWLVEEVIYDQLYTLMQHVYICHNGMYDSSQCLSCHFNLVIHLLIVWWC